MSQGHGHTIQTRAMARDRVGLCQNEQKFKSHRVTQAGGQYDQITENEDTLRPGVDERWHTEAIDLCSYDRQVFHPVLAIA